MKRARDRASLNPNDILNKNIIFKLVFPYLFPGCYKNSREAFLVYRKLAGVCCKLRYWNQLRRWIAWTCPDELTGAFTSHSFWCHMKIEEANEYQADSRTIIHTKESHHEFVLFRYRRIFIDVGVFPSNFETTLAGIPFYNTIDLNVARFIQSDNILSFKAPSFSELVLFCYALMMHEDSVYKNYLIKCSWKTAPDSDILYIEETKKHQTLANVLIGRLKKLGMTAPIEIGYTYGQMQTTSYKWFVAATSTNTKNRKRTALDKLDRFVKGWFSRELNHVTPALDFEISFCEEYGGSEED